MAQTIKLTDEGLALITASLTASTYKYVGWGTGTNAAAHGDTALQTPAAPARTAGTQSQQQTTVANDTYRVVAAITAGGTLAITELGIFDAAGTGSPPTGGNLFLREQFDALNLAANDVVTFTVNVPFAGA